MIGFIGMNIAKIGARKIKNCNIGNPIINNTIARPSRLLFRPLPDLVGSDIMF
jgi:hypothetical protein